MDHIHVTASPSPQSGLGDGKHALELGLSVQPDRNAAWFEELLKCFSGHRCCSPSALCLTLKGSGACVSCAAEPCVCALVAGSLRASANNNSNGSTAVLTKMSKKCLFLQLVHCITHTILERFCFKSLNAKVLFIQNVNCLGILLRRD